MSIFELPLLRHSVEKQYGQRIETSNDFERLSHVVYATTKQPISPSTLKRLWGYVHECRQPRVATLDVLSAYCGHEDFKGFCSYLKTKELAESAFFDTTAVLARDLSVGSEIHLGWLPDRFVRLRYLGCDTFEVLESQHAKLQTGDTFTAFEFMLHYPLRVLRIERNGTIIPHYTAGHLNGLTYLQKK